MSAWSSRRASLRADTSLLLAGLGDSPEAVAATLRNGGVRGQRRRSNDCPVARYLNAVMGADERVGTLQVGLVWVLIRRGRWWSPALTIPTPRPVRQFILAFDGGRFSALVGAGGSAGDDSKASPSRAAASSSLTDASEA
jgi:hypothetical protein